MLRRKVRRLEDLRSRAQTGGFGGVDAHQTLEELTEASTDVCDLIIALFAINPGNLESNVTCDGGDEISTFVDQLCRDGFDTDSIRSAVDDVVRRQSAIDPDPSVEMQHELRKLQQDVANLKELGEAARPRGLISIVVRVGLAVVAACSGGLTTALVFNDPIVKKALETALDTFIGVAVVEAGGAVIKGSRRPAGDKSTPECPETVGRHVNDPLSDDEGSRGSENVIPYQQEVHKERGGTNSGTTPDTDWGQRNDGGYGKN